MNAKYNLHNKKVNDANCNYVEQKPMSSLLVELSRFNSNSTSFYPC
jgi:hypothetical protein